MAKYRKNRKHKNKSWQGRYNILETLFQDFFFHILIQWSSLPFVKEIKAVGKAKSNEKYLGLVIKGGSVCNGMTSV